MIARRVRGVHLRFDGKRQLPWGLFIDVTINGKRYAPTKFFATEAEAERCYPAAAEEVARLRIEAANEAQLRKALVTELPTAPKGTVLFETLATRWLEEEIRPPRRTAATYRNYKGLLDRHLLPIMRTWPVTDDVMSKKRLKDVLRDQLYDKGLSLSMRVACQRCLSAFFSWALTELPPKQLQVNFAYKLGSQLRNDDEIAIQLRQEPNPMTRAQVEAFLAWQQEHQPQLWELFVWLADEGSRIGEACALKWSNIDGDKAHIVEAFSSSERWMERRRGKEDGLGEKDTKTHRTNQYIDLTDRVVEMLPKLKARTLEEWMKRGRYGKEPQHVFVNSKGRARRPDKTVYAAFRQACDDLNLRGQTGKKFTIHCLRDTFATLAILEKRLALGWVALMLGHATEETLKKHYFRWVRLVEANPLAGIKR
jgi:integrase